MAQIRLGRYEIKREILPDVCMRCGTPADRTRRTKFSWYPPWVWVLLLVGILPFLIVALVLTKKMTVPVGLCDNHRRHFLWGPLIIGGGFFLTAILVLGVFIIASVWASQKPHSIADTVFGLTCPAGIVALLGWLIAAIVLRLNTIRPSEITDNSITLVSVSPKYVRAAKALREEWEEEEDDRPRPRPRRRERSEQIYDPDAPRRRPEPPLDVEPVDEE
jgi:hypothetical protein